MWRAAEVAITVSIEVGGINKCFMVSLGCWRARETRTCDDAPHAHAFLLASAAGRWPRCLEANTIRSSPVGRGEPRANRNRKPAARWAFKAPCLRGATSHRDYRARCAGNLRSAACATDGGFLFSEALRRETGARPMPECHLQNITDVQVRECSVASQMQTRTRSFQPGG